MHWPAPVLTIETDADRGPVLVTVEYRIDPQRRDAFLAAIRDLGQERRRDGAYAWTFSKKRLRKGASWRRSWSRPGLSSFASTSA
jgi:transmembrane secretion effector